MINKNIINLLSLTFLIFSIVLSGACKKKEDFADKTSGCYDTDSPIHNGSIDYDDGSCQYAYVTAYEITKHPLQDPASSGIDWDIIVDPPEADLLLTIKYPLTGSANAISAGDTIWGGDVFFQSSEKTDQTYNTPAKWEAPYEIKLLNQKYAWELYDADALSADDFIASGTFNPIELANNGTIVTTDVNALNDTTVLTLYYTLK